MKSQDQKPLYHQIMNLLPPLTYLDVGARAMKQNRFVEAFPHAQYIGFELDVEECKRLNSLNIERHQFYPQAIGRKIETRTLYVTRNPACSSLYEPNSQEMRRFMECGPYFDVLEKKTVKTVSLDDWHRDNDLPGVEFLELDTQGSELDILQGSKHLLTSSVLGLQVEVELFPMYKDQPLFSDVDSYLQRRGFWLFDLSRYRLRRAYLKTRGQLLWGHAFYLKDVHQMEKRQLAQFLILAAIASYYGFEDYALEVLETILKNEFDLEPFDTLEIIKKVLDSHSERFSRPNQRGIKRLWKEPSEWKVAPRKDRGYFIKD
jgi:FkbM family methyltransferase